MSKDTTRSKFTFSVIPAARSAVVIFLACVATGNLHCGGCGFDRDYVGDVIDQRSQ